MLSDYFSLFVFLFIVLLFGSVTVFISSKLGPRKPNHVKLSTYECGMEPVGSSDFYYNVRFYKIGLLFILFDVEVVFFFPWALLAKELRLFGILEIIVFMAILVVGFVYAYKKGALEWE